MEIPQIDWKNNNNDDSASDELNEDLTDVDCRRYGWIVEDMEIGTSNDNDEDGDDGGEDQQTGVWYFHSVSLGCIYQNILSEIICNDIEC